MWRELFGRACAPVALTACLGEGVYALNSFLVSTAMPSAVHELGGIRFISWATTLYLVAAIVAGSAAGFLKERLGARRLLLAAAGLFLAGTLIAGGAVAMPMVLAGRTLQGAGEGAIAAACYTLVAELLPSRLVPKAFGLMAIVWAVAAFGGPLLGGLLTQTVSWRAAFLMNIPLIFGFAGLVLVAVPRGGGAAAADVPALRLGCIAGGIMLIAVAAVTGGVWVPALLVVAGIALLAWAFVADRAAANRLFPSDAFMPATTLGAGLWVVLLMPLGQASTSVFLPISIQNLWGYSPTAAGAVVAVMALSWSGTAILVALPRDSGLATFFIRLGPVLLTLGLAGAAVAVPARLPVLLFGCQMLIGCGFGVGWAFLNQAVTAAAGPGERDLASGLVPTTQAAGYAIGAAVAGLVANASGFSGALAAGQGGATGAWIFGISAGFALAAVVISFRARTAL